MKYKSALYENESYDDYCSQSKKVNGLENKLKELKKILSRERAILHLLTPDSSKNPDTWLKYDESFED